jgi:transcriptional regulator with XRE-family HTH domain
VNSITDHEGPMTEGDTPTVARRRVRLAIREARDAAGLTQNQVAEEMEWSLSKVIRIESGEVSISQNDLKPLLSYLGIRDKAVVAALVADARIARTRQRQAWYQKPEFRDYLSQQLLRLIEYEAEAVAIRNYSTHYIPGPIQTEEYAAALTGSHDELPPERIKAVVEARKVRRKTVLERLGSTLKFFCLLDESVFMRPTGGTTIFAAQLREVHRLATADLINVRMLPFTLPYPIANNATFDLLSLSSEPGSEVLYRENGVADELIEDPVVTARHLERFNQLWQIANNETDTIAFIKGRIEYLEHNIQRPGPP